MKAGDAEVILNVGRMVGRVTTGVGLQMDHVMLPATNSRILAKQGQFRGSFTIKRLFGYLRVPTPYFKIYINI